MANKHNISLTAEALIKHHGEDGAMEYCETRIQHHAQEKETDAENLWRAIGKTVAELIEGKPGLDEVVD